MSEPTRACPRCKGTGRLPGWIGKLMRKRRESVGITMREMARRLDLSATYLSDLENDRRGWNGQLINRFNAEVRRA